MRVFLLDFGLEMRGGQRQVFYLARVLAESGEFSPCLVSPKGSPLLKLAEKNGLETFPATGGRLGRLFSLSRFSRQLARLGEKAVVHTNDARSAAFGAAVRKKTPHCFLVHTRRVSYPLSEGKRGEKYRLGDAVVGVSAEIAEAVKAGGVAPERVHVIHSGIDPDLYPAKVERNDGRTVFVCLGALTRQKGHAVLLNALPALEGKFAPQAEESSWELRIIGEGPLFRPLLEQAQKLGVEKRLAFLGRQDSRVELCKCDILVAPSVDGEGSSAVLKEGWATGLPVICSDLPSNLELINPEVNGLSFASGNSAELAEAMFRLAGDAALRARLAENGRESLRGFTHLKMAGRYMELYRTLAGEHAD